MARVDIDEAPGQQAREEAPDDLQHIDASPNAFGAGLAQGLGEAGAGALDAAKFYGQVAADNGTNNTLEEVNKILHGDPSKTSMGPDGQPSGDTGYYGLRGADAMRARPEVAREISDIISKNRQGLSTPDSRLQYDNETRRYHAQWLNEVGSHADQQQGIWATDTNNTTAVIALNAIGRKPSDPATIAQQQELVNKAYVRNAQLKGEDPQGALLKAKQDVTYVRLRSMLVSNPAAAQDLLNGPDGEVLASRPDYDQISNAVKQGVINSQIGPATSQAIATAKAKALSIVGNVSGPDSIQAGAAQPNNIGNVKAAGGGFVAPASPQDGVTLAANNLREGYRGLTLRQIAEKWAPAGDHNDPAAWAATVSKASGIGPTDVPNLNDAKTVEKLVAGIGVAEKKGGDLTAFTPDVITKGVAASLAGQHANLAAAVTPPDFDTQTAPGMLKPGNLDPWHRPVLQNPDGSYSTTSSFSIGTEGGETLIPSVVDGKRLSQDEAIAHFKKTGENLGTFKTPQDADQYATALHNAQASMYDQHGNPIAQQKTTYPTVADALRGTEDETLTQAQADAIKMFPQYPDAQERYVQTVRRGLDQAIAQQDQQYVIDTHVVQQVMASDHPPTNEQQMIAMGPQVATAWRNVQMNSPTTAMTVEHMFDANARGIAKTYGTQLSSFLTRVLAPSGDPARITNSTQLWGNIDAQAGEKSPLTNTGVGMLTDLMLIRSGPHGEANAAQLGTFIKNYHEQQTFSNEIYGLKNGKGEDRFNKSMLTILPAITTGLKNGKTMAQMTDPKSPDYVGSLGVPLPGLTQKMSEITSAMENAGPAPPAPAALDPAKAQMLDSGVKSKQFTPAQSQQLKDLMLSVQARKMTPAQAKARAQQLGIFPPDVPRPQ